MSKNSLKILDENKNVPKFSCRRYTRMSESELVRVKNVRKWYKESTKFRYFWINFLSLDLGPFSDIFVFTKRKEYFFRHFWVIFRFENPKGTWLETSKDRNYYNHNYSWEIYSIETSLKITLTMAVTLVMVLEFKNHNFYYNHFTLPLKILT